MSNDLAEIAGYIAPCNFCGTQERIHRELNGRAICGRCIEKKEETEKPAAVARQEDEPAEELEAYPTNHFVIDGKVYDVLPRSLGGCKHSRAKNLEKLTAQTFNYCHFCGQRLKETTKKRTKKA
jgi:hypothetical protein